MTRIAPGWVSGRLRVATPLESTVVWPSGAPVPELTHATMPVDAGRFWLLTMVAVMTMVSPMVGAGSEEVTVTLYAGVVATMVAPTA